MESKTISLGKIIYVVVLSLLAGFASFYDSRPHAYVGYIVTLILVFIAGIISNRWIGALVGLVSTSAGFLARQFITQDISEKYLEAAQQFNAFIQSYFWLLILAAAFVGFIGGVAANLIQEEKRKPISHLHRLTLMALFIALSVAINSVRVGSVSFGGFPIIFSGYVLGPISGFIVGAIADVVGFIVRPSASPFNPLYTLTSALTGFIPVVVTSLFGKKDTKLVYWKVLIGILVGQTLTSVFLAPLFQMIFLNKGFWLLVGRAATKQAISIPIYAFLCVSIYDALVKTMKLDRTPRRKLSSENN